MTTREDIIEAARDLYTLVGPEGLSMRKVASHVGLSATAIYRHFDDKEDMIIEVCEEGFRLFERYLARGLAGDSPAERLRLTGVGYREFALENPAYYRVMFMSAHSNFERLHEASQTKTSPSFQMLVDRVAECIQVGVFPPLDPRQVSAMIWASVHGAVSLYLDGHLGLDRDAFCEFFDANQHLQNVGLAVR